MIRLCICLSQVCDCILFRWHMGTLACSSSSVHTGYSIQITIPAHLWLSFYGLLSIHWDWLRGCSVVGEKMQLSEGCCWVHMHAYMWWTSSHLPEWAEFVQVVLLFVVLYFDPIHQRMQQSSDNIDMFLYSMLWWYFSFCSSSLSPIFMNFWLCSTLAEHKVMSWATTLFCLLPCYVVYLHLCTRSHKHN